MAHPGKQIRFTRVMGVAVCDLCRWQGATLPQAEAQAERRAHLQSRRHQMFKRAHRSQSQSAWQAKRSASSSQSPQTE